MFWIITSSGEIRLLFWNYTERKCGSKIGWLQILKSEKCAVFWYAGRSPTGQFPDWHFPDGHFPERTIPQPDTSPIDISLTGHNPTKTFARPDIFPTGPFPDHMFSWEYVLFGELSGWETVLQSGRNGYLLVFYRNNYSNFE